MFLPTDPSTGVSRASAGGDTFTALDDCHRAVLDTLATLTRLIQRLDETGVDAEARRMAGEAVHFFNETARRHHAEEERHVFPSLLASGDAVLVQHVRRLLQDHGWLEEDWLTLEPPLSAIAEGYSWYDLDMLRQALPIFVDLYLDHIELEETLIYPEAKARQAPRPTAGRGREQRQQPLPAG